MLLLQPKHQISRNGQEPDSIFYTFLLFIVEQAYFLPINFKTNSSLIFFVLIVSLI